MFRIFSKYLFLHKKAVVPGIGVFSITRQPAKHEFAKKLFIAPALQIIFHPEPAVAEDKQFYSFLCHEQQIEEAEAIRRWSDFAYQLKENLNNYKEANLQALGHLSVTESGGLQFHSTQQLQDYFPDAVAERIVHHESETKMVSGDRSLVTTVNKVLRLKEPTEDADKRDYWWIFAIILALAGIAAIVYYYMQNGSIL